MQRHQPNRSHELSPAQQAELLAAFRRGDKQAFRFLYDVYEHSVYRFCRHLTGDEAQARDAFQETFIRFYEHRNDLHSDNVRSWLFTIARRSCLNIIRTQRKTHDVFDEVQHSEANMPLADIFLREQIERAMGCLPLALREALILRDIEGYTYQELADIIGIDISLAKVRVYRARLHMRKLLMPIVQEHRR